MAGPPRKDYGKTTATPFNKSGIFAGGSTTSGTAKAREKGPMSTRQRMGYLAEAAKSKTFRGGVGGSGGSVKSQWVGEGKDRKYVNVPEANKDSRRGAEAFKGGPTGSGTTTASDKKRDAGRGGSHGSVDAKGGPGSLSYYMKMTKDDGRGNAYNRAYTLFKRERKRAKQRGND